MVTIAPYVNYNRSALLGDLAGGAHWLEYPSDDYVMAAHLVWHAMRAIGLQQYAESWTGDNGRVGYTVIGMGVMESIELLWPTPPRRYRLRVRQAIYTLMKETGNAVCIVPGFPHLLSEWFVAQDYVAPAPRANRTKRTVRLALPDEQRVAPWGEDAVLLAVLNTKVFMLAKENERLTAENLALRERLKAIAHAIGQEAFKP